MFQHNLLLLAVCTERDGKLHRVAWKRGYSCLAESPTNIAVHVHVCVYLMYVSISGDQEHEHENK